MVEFELNRLLEKAPVIACAGQHQQALIEGHQPDRRNRGVHVVLKCARLLRRYESFEQRLAQYLEAGDNGLHPPLSRAAEFDRRVGDQAAEALTTGFVQE